MSEPTAPPKKGLSTGAKIAIGCLVAVVVAIGGCLAIGGYGLYRLKQWVGDVEKDPNAATVKAVELAMKLNPEVDVVASDPKAGTITLREKKTGKVVTFNAIDLQAGKFTFEEDGKKATFDFDQKGEAGGALTIETEEGKAVFGAGEAVAVPSWVPSYPGAAQEGFNSLEAGGERTGTFTLRTADSVEQVVAWYEAELKSAGFEVEKSTLDISGAVTANLNAKAGSRGVNIVVSSQEGETQGLVAYSEKREGQ
jgi:hypothetical protein